MKKYQVFDGTAGKTEQDGLDKIALIETLLGYPNATAKTTDYGILPKHPTLDKWYLPVIDALVDACAEKTSEERAQYYDPSELKTYEELDADGFFPPLDPPE